MVFRVTMVGTNAQEDHTSSLFRSKETSVLPIDGACSFKTAYLRTWYHDVVSHAAHIVYPIRRENLKSQL